MKLGIDVVHGQYLKTSARGGNKCRAPQTECPGCKRQVDKENYSKNQHYCKQCSNGYKSLRSKIKKLTDSDRAAQQAAWIEKNAG